MPKPRKSYEYPTPQGVFTVQQKHSPRGYRGWVWVLTDPDGSTTVHETKREAVAEIPKGPKARRNPASKPETFKVRLRKHGGSFGPYKSFQSAVTQGRRKAAKLGIKSDSENYLLIYADGVLVAQASLEWGGWLVDFRNTKANPPRAPKARRDSKTGRFKANPGKAAAVKRAPKPRARIRPKGQAKAKPPRPRKNPPTTREMKAAAKPLPLPSRKLSEPEWTTVERIAHQKGWDRLLGSLAHEARARAKILDSPRGGPPTAEDFALSNRYHMAADVLTWAYDKLRFLGL